MKPQAKYLKKAQILSVMKEKHFLMVKEPFWSEVFEYLDPKNEQLDFNKFIFVFRASFCVYEKVKNYK